MSNWRDGYVTDTEYTTAYYSQHSPVTIDAAQFFQRYRPVRNGPEFRYFELGCGTGLTSVLMAAGHPEAFFEANDFMPEHIVIAQDLAAKLEIENVRFTDESFGDLNKRPHEPYDYIMAHGIYTWVSDARKAEIREFVDNNLKPGGNFSVTYNCRVGWAGLQNIDVLFKAYLAAAPDHSAPNLARDIFEKIQEWFSINEGYFQSEGEAYEFVKDILSKSHDSRYLLHEYGHANWSPLYSAEVIAEMQELRLAYAGAPAVLHNIPETCLPTRVQEHVAKHGSVIDQQTLVDFALNSTFRQDLYRRGAVPVDIKQMTRQFGNVAFVLAKPLDACYMSVKIPAGKMDLNEQIHGGMLKLAEQGGKTFNDFCEFGRKLSLSPQDVLTCMGILYGVGYLHMASPYPSDAAHFDRVNKRISDLAVTGYKDLKFLLSPLTREPIRVDFLDLLMFGCGITDDAEKLFEASMARLREDDVEINDKDGNPVPENVIKDAIEAGAKKYVADVVPYYESYGIIR